MLVIAEVGQAHEGSLGMALSYIGALAEAGVDAVKFQVHIAEAESSILEPFRIKFSEQDKTRFDYWKRMEFSTDEWKLIKKTCEDNNVEFLASPFSNAAVDLLEEVGVKRYKIGSGEVNNFLLLEKIAKTGKQVIISSGMSSFDELDATVSFLRERKISFSLLQCTTSYPTTPANYGLNVIQELKQRYKVKVGYSDHSSKIETCIAATAMGAEILEFHAVFSRKSFGPDVSSSLELSEIRMLVAAIRNISTALNEPVSKADNSKYSGLKQIFEKSLAVNKDLRKGEIIKFEHLEAKKPKEYGIDASQFDQVIGKKIANDINRFDFLTWSHLAE
ncbi:N-acetylneuraminate synthase family protein [Christiangramia forsetii]|uniref:N-acetylneuraminate synthase n=2 Tax=Christiangramia forsetii TaxID=411153 RepID=A0LYV7_CHRFK|nr:N-acetylneuraminate synthase family protein [Christiangramia forsetii]GGG33245.1 N,N'-diacetyllegionaminic acid synthase [Christiangramia forsetii]CAL65552.1 N-acetylneuraminate synthase [Christiangramia forsetii KT0803]